MERKRPGANGGSPPGWTRTGAILAGSPGGA